MIIIVTGSDDEGKSKKGNASGSDHSDAEA